MIVEHADNLVDDVCRISIAELLGRMEAHGFDDDVIDQMIGLHAAVMGGWRLPRFMVLMVSFGTVSSRCAET